MGSSENRSATPAPRSAFAASREALVTETTAGIREDAERAGFRIDAGGARAEIVGHAELGEEASDEVDVSGPPPGALDRPATERLGVGADRLAMARGASPRRGRRAPEQRGGSC